jgi:hypothetical protein
MNKKFAIVVLSCSLPEYHKFKLAQKRSWIIDAESCGIKTYFIEGNGNYFDPNIFIKNVQSLATYDQNTIKFNCDDSLKGSFLKTLLGLNEIFSKTDVDFIFRTNLSSYLDIEMMEKYIKIHQIGSSVYSGVCGSTKIIKERAYINGFLKTNIILSKTDFISKRIHFASGAGYFIGREQFNSLCKTSRFINLVDDVGIGYYLTKNDINPITNLPRFWVPERSEKKMTKEYLQFIQDGGFHYRFKSNSRDNDANMLQSFSDHNFRKNWCVE